MQAIRPALVVAVLLAGAGASGAFEASGERWVDGAFAVQAEITHPTAGSISMTGISWNTAFAEAAASWNTPSGGLIDITVNTGVFENPCGSNNGIHGTDFGSDNCGTAFGSSTLAVARKTFSLGGLITHANIIFDQAKNYDVFEGPFTDSRRDFRRVAVHEIGHLLGLDHSLAAPAVMEPITSSIEVPQTDDISGITFIYDLGCPQYSSSTGAPISGELHASDCFDTEVGLPLPTTGIQQEEPDAFVDLYKVKATGDEFNFTLSSPGVNAGGFNPILMLVNDSLSSQVAADFTTPMMSSLDVTPDPGDYVLVVRGVFEGAGGTYTLTGVPAVPEPTQTTLAAAALATLAGLSRARRKRSPL